MYTKRKEEDRVNGLLVGDIQHITHKNHTKTKVIREKKDKGNIVEVIYSHMIG